MRTGYSVVLALVALAALLGLNHRFVCPEYQQRAIDIAVLLGILLLALPAIRINEQARKIARVQSAKVKLDEDREAFSTLAEEARPAMEASIKAYEVTLQQMIGRLVEEKGSWNPGVHLLLYGGYVLMLAAALVRVFPLSGC